MSRARGRTALDVCADCGASDPSWASINRGILLCMECCSVHRSLGRHISHVKSLHQGTWPPSLLNMINALTLQNVNSIWEHSLLDSAASKHLRRKPQPKDALHSVKFDFIKAKHLKLAYVFRPRRDDVPCNAIELSRQLHSSVRSTNLDISLRLLVQGADPNYFNQEKGTSCLHVACRTGNASQAELLVAWGADPNVKDASGSTPSALARLGGHLELADRMTELVYEVTDRLSYHLCNKKPDHKNGQHYIGLDKIEPHEMTDVAKAARGKLQLLPNHLFEELIMDIYDEIDRRECEAVWITSAMGLERFGVAFLPVNPALSAPRNQGRQKLARLSAAEMAALLRDILMDASRRQHIATLKPNSISLPQKGNVKMNYLKQMTHLSDDEPLYDSVASDDDYAALVTPFPKEEQVSPKFGENVFKNSEASMNDTIFSNSNADNFANDRQSNNSFVQNIQEIEQLRKQINLKDSTIEELKSELQLLKTAMESLKMENVLLKNNVEKRNSITSTNSPPTRDVSSPQICSVKDPGEKENNLKYYNNDSFEVRSVTKSNPRPNSMFESRERTKYDWNITKQQLKSLDGNNTISEATSSKETADVSALPNSIDVHKHAELVTKRLQEICAAVHSPTPNGTVFEIKAKMINVVVERLISIFPEKCDETTASLISQLSSSCKELFVACSRWSELNFDSDIMDPSVLVSQVRLAAYDLAKSTKMLVSNFPLAADESQ